MTSTRLQALVYKNSLISAFLSAVFSSTFRYLALATSFALNVTLQLFNSHLLILYDELQQVSNCNHAGRPTLLDHGQVAYIVLTHQCHAGISGRRWTDEGHISRHDGGI